MSILLIEKLRMRSKACDSKRREFHIYMLLNLWQWSCLLVIIFATPKASACDVF
jgi:hypothetical protein